LLAVLTDVRGKSSKNIPVVSETQLEEDTNTTMADLPVTEAGLLFGQVRKVKAVSTTV
jgi:hypothetical protein